jgi:hypothetical protein
VWEKVRYESEVKQMTPQEIIEYCEKQLALGNRNVGFMLPGRWGKRNTRRLWPGGPEGVIVAELPRGIFVLFDIKEVLNQTKEIMKKLEVSPDA